MTVYVVDDGGNRAGDISQMTAETSREMENLGN